jgi:hypothetical protein
MTFSIDGTVVGSYVVAWIYRTFEGRSTQRSVIGMSILFAALICGGMVGTGALCGTGE